MGGRAGGGGGRGMGAGASKPSHSEVLQGLKELQNAKNAYVRAGKMAAKSGGYQWTAQTQAAYQEGVAKQQKLFATEQKTFEKYKATFARVSKMVKAFNGTELKFENAELFK